MLIFRPILQNKNRGGIIMIEQYVSIFMFIQSMVLGFTIAFNSKNFKNLFLGLFLLCFAFENVGDILEYFNLLQKYYYLEYLPINFYLFAIPFLYLYTKKITGSFNLKKDYKHLIPGIVEFISESVVFIYVINNKDFLDNKYLFLYLTLFLIAGFTISIIYMYKNLKLIEHYNKQLAQNYSNIEKIHLKWLKNANLYYVLLGIITLIIFSIDFSENFQLAYIVVGFFEIVFLYWISLSGIKQSNLITLNELYIHNAEKTIIKDKPITPNDEFEYLKRFIAENKPYLDSNLSLDKLSELCSISKRRLSNLINTNTSTNFNKFINEYRIEEAKQLLKNTSYDKLNILGIALESGFNSKATFYLYFRKFCGISPSQFKKQELLRK